jgi:transcriptional regulator with XRE-family HTH domain
MAPLATNDDFNNLFIRENLKRLRTSHGLSMLAVAKIINKTRQAYANYEAGQREINIHDLITLSGFYGVSVDNILGNPYSNKNDTTLSFRTYALKDGELKVSPQQTLTAINDDVVVVIRDEFHVDFFWRTQVYHEGIVMLFDYNNKTYSSKVFYNKDKSGFFFIDDKPFFFNKVHGENIIYIGVYNSTLTKAFTIPNFF